jgi:hypothetical protein
MKIGWRFKFTLVGSKKEKSATLYNYNYSLACDELEKKFGKCKIIECYRGNPEQWLPISVSNSAPQSKSMFGANEAWTDMAREIDDAAHNAIMPIIESYVASGYKAREIAHVINAAVLSAECEVMVRRRSSPKVRQ